MIDAKNRNRPKTTLVANASSASSPAKLRAIGAALLFDICWKRYRDGMTELEKRFLINFDSPTELRTGQWPPGPILLRPGTQQKCVLTD